VISGNQTIYSLPTIQ